MVLSQDAQGRLLVFAVQVDVTNFNITEFTRTDELAAVGVETTEASIERIRTALADLDRQLFSARSRTT